MSRNRHDRDELHFGLLPADLVELSSALGPLPAGMSLEDALRWLWDRLLALEAGTIKVQGFRAEALIALGAFFDAVIEALPSWRDTFERPGGNALGPTSGLSEIGPFTFSRLPTTGFTSPSPMTLLISASPSGYALYGQTLDIAGASARLSSFPQFSTGTVYFNFYVPLAWNSANYTYVLRFQRGDVTDQVFQVGNSPFNGSQWTVFAAGGFTSISVAANTWYTIRAELARMGEVSRWKIWKAGDPEPATWRVEATVEAEPFDAVDATIWLLSRRIGAIPVQSNSSWHVGLDNIRVYKTDTDPWRWQKIFAIDAVQHKAQAASFVIDSFLARGLTADAVLRKAIAASFSMSAVSKATFQAPLTIDAIRKATLSGTLTLDAVIALLGQGFTLDAVIAAVGGAGIYDEAGAYDEAGTYD